MFAGLDPAALDGLEAFTFRCEFPPGELIVEEGRTGNGLFIIISGEVEVIKGLETANPQTIVNLGPGEPFGEMSLLGEWPRSASVRALSHTVCLGMDRWVFLDHLNKEPAIAIRMLQILAQRLADLNDTLTGK